MEEQRLESRWVDVDGRQVHVRCALGRGQPVLLVHGAAVSSAHVLPTAEALADRVDVVVPDLPGHGRSDDPPRVLDAAGHAQALAGILDALGLACVWLVGNSFGCQVIAAFASAHPERVAGVVLQGPTVDPGARGFPRQLGRWLVNSVREGATQPSETFRQWAQAGPRVFVLTLRAMFRDRIERRLPAVTAPALVVRGDRDPIISADWAHRATAMLPRGELAIVPDATHTMTVTDPERLAGLVLEFMRAHEGPP